ncbi:hypothetical protein QFC21_003452 [Naganishia friedmannii]|uniref:Uncharacterized protein n=1 Tax=Naganishia friedmannii TaxID=89922 RepID=A0ACC2VPZ1_9TREE|nr:hypothetical protein QFC21_003452 [Naganishia friedmannii]
MFRFAVLRNAARPTVPSASRTFSTTRVAFKAQTVQEINAKAKSLGIPPPPKSPLGAYAEFFRELYPTIRDKYVKAETGRIDSHEVARVAGAKWNALAEEERKSEGPLPEAAVWRLRILLLASLEAARRAAENQSLIERSDRAQRESVSCAAGYESEGPLPEAAVCRLRILLLASLEAARRYESEGPLPEAAVWRLRILLLASLEAARRAAENQSLIERSDRAQRESVSSRGCRPRISLPEAAVWRLRILLLGSLEAKYNQAAKQATERYKLNYKRYYESLSPEQVLSLRLDSPETKGLKRGVRNAAQRALRGEPARPAGSFFIFLHGFRKSDELRDMMQRDGVDAAKSAIYTAKKAGEKWALMSPEEKQKFVDESVQQRNVYAEWKEGKEKKA